MPFSQQQFFEVFQRYNDAVWPAQIALCAFAIIAVAVAYRSRLGDGRYVAGMLALLWAWTAVGYHIAFFSAINPAAFVFAALFLLQSALFFWYGVIRQNFTLSATVSGWHAAGALLITYALILYPLIAMMSGQRYPAMPTFGLPCPTTIFTLGVLMWTRSAPRSVWIIPILWAVIATQVAVRFDVYEDFGLTLAALVAVVCLFSNRRTGRVVQSSAAI
jgi:Family of unknown function (DUF6064)